ncbi:HlyD family efflux transporter periplasmic adaptor subunit [Legionella israelensis]|uniref:HlyD family efflux transporter periplasmic adaptor subunit n=1 Tax=Legionella israelensis TaxID=454 RepID=A0AAX1EHS5_9GAMM|nr:HlyD family efflux transporter periplasmic adaptor subunit [Legionella israelensis]QBR84633.1 HlyD family efflux transporter periplasmic adaptor subunit [Legionella israelensis]
MIKEKITTKHMIKRFLFFTLLTLLLLSCGKPKEHHYQGYVEGENVFLASPNSGVLEKLLVQRGERVGQGQMLFKLDSDPEQLLVKQRRAELIQAQQTLQDLKRPRRPPEIAAIKAQIKQTEARIKLAELVVKRRRELYERNATDKETMDEAVAEYEELQQLKAQYQANLALAQLGSRERQIKAQQALVESLEEKLQEAKWQLAQKSLSAPANGFIFDTFFREGEFVGTQQPVLALLPPENIRIEFFIPVDHLSKIYLRQKIAFKCYGCDKKSEATVSYISPEAEYIPPLVYSRENAEKLVFRIKARVAEPWMFKPGQPVTVILP